MYIFFGKGNEKQELGLSFLERERIKSAVKRVDSISDRMSYIILRGRWCDINVLNVLTQTWDEIDVKDGFYEVLEHVFDKFPKYHTETLL
jgi:hypothetical protein